MASKTYTINLGGLEHLNPLKDGVVKPKSFGLEIIEISPMPAGIRRMVRTLEFDISEMATATYLGALATNVPMTAIPVFPLRALHHGLPFYNVKSGIQGPADVTGKRFGMRSYTFTPGVWVRGILQSEYGVDPSLQTCVRTGDEHVLGYEYPPNAELAPEGSDMATMLASGELDVAVGVGNADSSDVLPLFPNPKQAATNFYRKTGIYPIDHMVVIKNELLKSDPGIAEDLFEAFKNAKDKYFAHLNSGDPLTPGDMAISERMGALGGDPLPYGLASNRKTLEAFIGYCVAQKIIPQTMNADDLFAPNTLNLA